jgi:hypothetical protein
MDVSDKMDKKKFDKIMDEWLAQEMEAVPDLKPSPEVYQKLEDKEKRRKVSFFSWPVRLAAAGIAATLITLVIVFQPPKEVEPFLGLREGAVEELAEQEVSLDRVQARGEAETEEPAEKVIKPETAKIQKRVEEGAKQEGKEEIEFEEPPEKTKTKDEVIKAKEADKEAFVQPKEVAARRRMELEPEKKEVKSLVKTSRIAAVAPAAPAQILTERVEFQFQPKGSEHIVDRDIDSLLDEIISLSSEDNYRLVLQLPQERYVYVYQVGADKQLIRLFPNTEFNPAQNPIQAGKTIFIPIPPHWFFVEEDAGEVFVYVVTSAEPLKNWDGHYAEYSQARSIKNKREISAKFLDLIKKDKQDPEDQVSVRVFKFNIN